MSNEAEIEGGTGKEGVRGEGARGCGGSGVGGRLFEKRGVESELVSIAGGGHASLAGGCVSS